MGKTPTFIPQSVAKVAQIDKIMEQAQVFASSWSLVGGQFDSGGMLKDAEEARTELREMIIKVIDA